MTTSDTAPVVFVGAATLDAIALVDRFPQPDQRQVARDVVHAGGGPAATAAVAASRLGVPAALVSAVGADDEGQQILASLRREGVDVSGVQVVPERRSGSSVVVVDASSGTRAICTRPVPELDIPSGGAAGRLLRAASWVHVDHLGWGHLQAWQRSGGRPAEQRVSVDAGNPIPGFMPQGVDLYVPTVGALTRLHGELPLDRLMHAAVRAGARMVVATRGGGGCAALTTDGTCLEVPGHRVKVLSTLGAGDVFHGALLAAVVRGMPLRECMRYANITAALSCRGLDGRSAIPTHDDVLAVISTLPSSLTRPPATEEQS